MGFEPTVGFKAHVRFRVECLRPAQPSLHLEDIGGCTRFAEYCKEQNHRPRHLKALTSWRRQRPERCLRLKSLSLIMRECTLFRTGRRLRHTLPFLRLHQPGTGRKQKKRGKYKQKGDCKAFHYFLLKS